MIKQVITEINQIVIDSALVERYGKYCIHKTDKEIPYGIGKEKDCKGNTYTFDERLENVAYLEMQPYKTNVVNNLMTNIDLVFNIHHFVTVKKANDDIYHQRNLQLFQYVFNAIKAKKNYHRASVITNSLNDVNEKCEYGIINIKFSMYLDCDYVPDLDPQNC